MATLNSTLPYQQSSIPGPPGLTYIGNWNSSTAYTLRQVVLLNGSSYVCLIANTNIDPSTDTQKWALLVGKGATGATGPQGVKGDPGDTTNVLMQPVHTAGNINGTSTDTATLETALSSRSYKNLFVEENGPTNNPYVTTQNQSILYPNRFHPSSPGLMRILGRTLPFGDINQPLTIYVGANEAITTLSMASSYLHDRRIRPNANVTVQVADGTYNENELYMNHPDMTKVNWFGNRTIPSNCILRFDATSNKNGFKADGCTIRIDGFRLLGIGATGASRIDWNDQCYGAACLSYGGGSNIILGSKIEILNYYCGLLADTGGVIVGSRTKITRAGNYGVLARNGGIVNCSYLDIATVAHRSSNGSIFGIGILSEGGKIDASLGAATDCEVAGIAAYDEGRIVALGFNTHHNVGYGARVRSNSVLTMNIEPVTNTKSFCSYNAADGIYVSDGGLMYMSGTVSPNRIEIRDNTGHGIKVEDGGLFKSNNALVYNNGGKGALSTGQAARLYLYDSNVYNNIGGGVETANSGYTFYNLVP